MRNFLGSIFLGLLLLLPVAVQAEVIHSFESDILLDADGSFTVTETILYDFESAERHGIFRTIPTVHPEEASRWYKDRYIKVNVQNVLMDGKEVLYEVNSPGKNIKIKIGDPHETITGSHIYTIVYTVEGALFYRADSTVELYWNSTGDDWPVAIGSARVLVRADENILSADAACYIGTTGSEERCETVVAPGETLFIGRALLAGEGITVAHSLNTDMVPRVIFERVSFIWVLLLLLPLLLVAGPVYMYRVRTKHKIKAPIIAEYEPYDNITPIYAGMLVDEVLHPHDITAGIVYLAEQGFLKIKKIDKKFWIFNTNDYEVSLLRSPKEIQETFLTRVMKLLFGEEAVAGSVVTLSGIKESLPKQKVNAEILHELRKALKADMKVRGFFENSYVNAKKSGFMALLLLLGVAVVLVVFSIELIVLVFFIFFEALIILLVTYTRRTRKGYEAMNHLKGFREFLSVTGKDRFKFHNDPAKKPEQFLEYLPYAIAFGVEKEWAKVFEGVTIPNPTWYDGGNAAVFSAVAFTGDMSAFSTSLSTSSGAAASSGGGSSGGGAGGGGGGSW